MAKQPRTDLLEDATEPPAGPVTETITYRPGRHDPETVTWGGHIFVADEPKEITGHAKGTEKERLSLHVINSARNNPHFSIGNAPRRRDTMTNPTNAQEYKQYFVNWLKGPNITSVRELINRWVKDRNLQIACEVGGDDYQWMGSLFAPKMADLQRQDEMTDEQVAAAWRHAGVNQLPFQFT